MAINNIPSGMRDRLFTECTLRRGIESRLRLLFGHYGYGEAETPTIEYYSTFLRAGNALAEERMYKTGDIDGRILVLRPDNTTPVARLYATKLKNAPQPQRLFYVQKAFSTGLAHRGDSSEELQAGVELIGVGGLRADLEVLALAIRALEASGVQNFHIEIGHAGLFRALARELRGGDELEEEIRGLVERKNYAALGDVLAPYNGNSAAAALKKLVGLFGGEEILPEARALSTSTEAQDCVSYLEKLLCELKAAGYFKYVRFDMGLVHGIDYYTGIVFRGYADGAGEPVLNGGRYDGMLHSFGADEPATGWGLNIDALSSCLEAPAATQTETLIHFESGSLGRALMLAESGESSELSPCDSVEESVAIAKAKGIPTVIIVTETGEKAIRVE